MGIERSGLLGVDLMPAVDGLVVPETFYLVTRNPAYLAGMKLPTASTPWETLFRGGMRSILCLTETPPQYSPYPLKIAGHFPLADLYGNRYPSSPQRELEMIGRAVQCALDLLHDRCGVIIHCEGGTGRTGTVIGCVLKCLGYNSREVISYLDTLNRSRGARVGWPESTWQSETVKHFKALDE